MSLLVKLKQFQISDSECHNNTYNLNPLTTPPHKKKKKRMSHENNFRYWFAEVSDVFSFLVIIYNITTLGKFIYLFNVLVFKVPINSESLLLLSLHIIASMSQKPWVSWLSSSFQWKSGHSCSVLDLHLQEFSIFQTFLWSIKTNVSVLYIT